MKFINWLPIGLALIIVLGWLSTSRGLVNHNDKINGGWKVFKFTLDGQDAWSLVEWPKFSFYPGEFRCSPLFLDLQPLPNEKKSIAVFEWSWLTGDSVIIVDNRYGLLSGEWGVEFIDKSVPDMTLTRAGGDTIVMSKVALFGDNWVPISVPD